MPFVEIIQKYSSCILPEALSPDYKTLCSRVKYDLLPDYKGFCRRVNKLQVIYNLNTFEYFPQRTYEFFLVFYY